MSVRRTTTILLAASGLAVLSACGSSSTKTVSVANTTPLVAPTATTTTATGTTSSSTSSSAGQSSATTTTASASATARTQSGPAFVQTTTAGASGPAAVVIAHGYSPASPSTYNPQNTLQVIIADNQATIDSQGGRQKAFFFVNGSYIGTDTSLPSNSITLVNESDTEVTLGYALVHPDGSSAGVAQVRYALNNGTLSPLDPIPSASPSAAVSRR